MTRTRRPSEIRFIALTLLLCCAAFLSACSGSSNSQKQAAESGLQTLRDMAGPDDYRFFGYESAADVGKEELGEPLGIKTLDTEALLASPNPAESMIVEGDEYLFPVTVNGKPIGGIQVIIEDGKWVNEETVAKAEVKKVLDTMASNSLDPAKSYILDLEEIELSFVGFVKDGRNVLIPLFKSSPASLVLGTMYNFTDIANILKDEIIAARDSYLDMIPDATAILEKQSVPPAQSPVGRRAAADAGGKSESLIDVQLIAQEQGQWCWAATGAMTMGFAGGDTSTFTQCAQADKAFSQTSCCDDGATSNCNKPHKPRYEQWGFSATKVYEESGVALSWTELKGLIDAKKPVAFLWRWRIGGGHYMVAVGYYEDATTMPPIRMVLINDPWPPEVGKQQVVTYNKWVGGSRYNNLQTCYFYNIAKN